MGMNVVFYIITNNSIKYHEFHLLFSEYIVEYITSGESISNGVKTINNLWKITCTGATAETEIEKYLVKNNNVIQYFKLYF
jgi:hypothetical protein